MKLVELFQGGKEWKVVFQGSEELIIEFKIEETGYRFHAYMETEDETGRTWNIEFSADDPTNQEKTYKDGYGITGTGNSVTVFSTVVDIMRYFLNKYNKRIEKILFTAEEPSRRKLYTHMIKKLLPSWGFSRDFYDITLTRP